MTNAQRKAIFFMLKKCGCPAEREQRIAWVNGLLFARGANKTIASLNELNEEQATWLAAVLRKRIDAKRGIENHG